MANAFQLDSAFQLQEHLKALHHHHTKPPNSNHTIPITRTTASIIATPPEDVDRALWLYELCRFLINKCNDLIVGFLFDSPPCSSTTCPEMRASEWQFLCAVHESPKSCCAIDYCCHTLDWATNIVTSQKIFPSRLSLAAGDAQDDRGAGVKHLVNIFRRLHRIFAHAWFQHRGVFWQVESQTGLYVLFKMVCDSYELLPAENYKLPPQAEGLEPTAEAVQPVPTILKAEALSAIGDSSLEGEDQNFMGIGRTNTRRHIRSSPSTGSAVTTVHEAEEEETDVAHKLASMHIARNGSMSTEETDREIEIEPEIEPEIESEMNTEMEADITIIAGPEDHQVMISTIEVDEIEESELKVPMAESPTLPSAEPLTQATTAESPVLPKAEEEAKEDAKVEADAEEEVEAAVAVAEKVEILPESALEHTVHKPNVDEEPSSETVVEKFVDPSTETSRAEGKVMEISKSGTTKEDEPESA
jgi:hypothetical protein